MSALISGLKKFVPWPFLWWRVAFSQVNPQTQGLAFCAGADACLLLISSRGGHRRTRPQLPQPARRLGTFTEDGCAGVVARRRFPPLRL